MFFFYKKQSDGTDFFSGKRPWSIIKDDILRNYLPPYLRKVNKLNNRIILVDGFAGPGKFDDGSYGSPYYICSIAQEYIPGKFLAVLVNKNKEHHDKLTVLLNSYIDQGSALTIHGTAKDLLHYLHSRVHNETLFIYLDQFGISGFEFEDILPFISRDKIFSTEIIMNLCVPVIHRLSGKISGDKSGHVILNKVFGGDYWKNIMMDASMNPTEQIFKLMELYINKLSDYVEFVGYCPIHRRGPKSSIKYFIIFASRHIDAVLLLNDIMFKACWKNIWESTPEGSFFREEGIRLVLPLGYFTELKSCILKEIDNKMLSRQQVWQNIVLNNFMRFSKSDFNHEVKKLITQKKIQFRDVRGTGRLNDDTILFLKDV